MSKINVSIEWCIEKLEQLQKCNMNPEACSHDVNEHGKKQPFDSASIDMTLDAVICELKRTKATHDNVTCTKYNEPVLPDENGNCSLCGAALIDQWLFN